MELNENFFGRKAEVVAKELLGKNLVRKLDGRELISKIVETEAYYGSRDPASRAYRKTEMSKVMFSKPGTIFVYNVHKYWMFNIVAEEEGKAGAVLIRALEPLNFEGNLSGPGKLTQELKITRDFNKKHILDVKDILIKNTAEKVEIKKTNRIGVKRDLKKKLRFFIKGNEFVSR